MNEGSLDIAEVARRSGLAPSALRFYEKKELITSAGRNGLRRTYRPDVLERLELITCARGAGFSIAEISRFLVARPGDPDLRVRMAARARTLDEQIGRLSRLRDSLRHAAVCDHEPIVECPDFKQAIGNEPAGREDGHRGPVHTAGADVMTRPTGADPTRRT
ncbi:merR family transcriptional regulator [Planomonospora sphaerica]|uniref:MerR family transcriptional regulator n=1 Tax=Planomonospora sphaerica TaxID=161355 RepID=A0A161MD74_9ACTN|nr:MerR family transcriptional regulator [Planomonospora sphaerica]GAT69433.1 merR family transcriptional regulator [Planomonospora sphaerica]